MDRTTFLIDGFNLYHSLRDASRDLGFKESRRVKWLDIRVLCASYLHLISRTATLEEICYFSALATHRDAQDPGTTGRHRAYIRCLEDTGIVVKLGRFKPVEVRCKKCGQLTARFEEKETDVAISVRLLETFHLDACDTCVIVSGDTDLAPAVRSARQLFPSKRVVFAFPYGRASNELRRLANGSFRISKETYAKWQFPHTVILSDGTTVTRPAAW